MWTGADLGGGGGGGKGRTPFLRDSTSAHPKVPLCTILRYQFLVTDPKKFVKGPLAPIYTNFEGARAEKTQFFGQIFPKSA